MQNSVNLTPDNEIKQLRKENQGYDNYVKY